MSFAACCSTLTPRLAARRASASAERRPMPGELLATTRPRVLLTDKTDGCEAFVPRERAASPTPRPSSGCAPLVTPSVEGSGKGSLWPISPSQILKSQHQDFGASSRQRKRERRSAQPFIACRRAPPPCAMAAPAAEPPKMDTSVMDAAMAGDPASESIAVYARLKPVGKSDTRGDVVVPKRFGKQKSVQVRTTVMWQS